MLRCKIRNCEKRRSDQPQAVNEAGVLIYLGNFLKGRFKNELI